MKRRRALVTSATWNCGLACVRELGRAGYEVLGADDQLLPFGLHSRYSSPYLYCPPHQSPEFVEGLLRLVRETEPDVLIAHGTKRVEAVVEHWEEFDRLTGVAAPPLDSFQVAADKVRTIMECMSLGIPCPRVLTQEESIQELSQGSPGGLPARVVVKPRQDFGSGRGLAYVEAPECFESSLAQVRVGYGDVLLQEYIPGGPEAMRTLMVLFDRDSQLVAYFMTRKIHIWPPERGISALNESVDEPELLEMMMPFFEKWPWRGPAEVEFKVDARDGKPKVIEINPRFGGYVGFPARCGMPFAEMAASAALGEWGWQVCPPYRTGVRCVLPPLYARVLATELLKGRRRKQLLGEAWSIATGGAVVGNSDATDPLPRLGKWLKQSRKALAGLLSSTENREKGLNLE